MIEPRLIYGDKDRDTEREEEHNFEYTFDIWLLM